MKEGLRDAVKGGITKVQARYDEAKYYCLARCRGEGVPNIGYAILMRHLIWSLPEGATGTAVHRVGTKRI